MRYHIVITTFLALILSGCHDEFLNDRAYSIITEDNFFQNASDAVTAVNGVYDALTGNGMYQRELLWLNEFPSELVTTRLDIGQSNSNHDLWQFQPGDFGSIYSSSYSLIERANQVIANVPKIDMQESLKNRVVAEAIFLRALVYFNLVRVYGGVPLKIAPTTDFNNLRFSRASAAEIYSFIIDELQGILTANSLPLTSAYGAADKGRVGKSAVQALLGKVFLTRATESFGSAADYQSAINVLSACVTESDRSLLPSFENIFKTTNENNAEVIFDVQYIRQSGLGGNLTSFLPTQGSREFFILPYYDFPVNIDFYQSFEDGDMRRAATFHDRIKTTVNNVANVELYFDPDADPYEGTWRRVDDNSLIPRTVVAAAVPGFRKFVDFDPLARANAEEPNFIVLRYADVILMLAEAMNEVNGGPTAQAYEYLNMVRRRAFGKPVNTPDAEVDYSGLDKQGFRNAIFTERRKEFVIEAQSWFDGKRFWDIYTQRVADASIGADPNISNRPKAVIDVNRIRQDQYKLMPFSPDQLDLNPALEQNPGW